MDAASDLNFDGICRTCMHVVVEEGTFAATTEKQSEVQCCSIFDTIAECGSMRIVELLVTTTPQLQVHISDELPQKICQECLHLLQSVYRFQQMCIKSDQQMREILAKRYPDVKLIIPAILTESIAETKEFSMVEAREGEIETEALNNSLEVPLANDPLRNEQFVKMEECFDVDEYNGEVKTHEASVAATNLVDPSLIIEVGTPTTAHESEATSNGNPDVKLIIPPLIYFPRLEKKQFLVVEANRGEIKSEAVNNSLEVPLANDPLQNIEFLKMEEFIDEDEYNGGDKTHEASVAGTDIVDPSLIIEVGAPTTPHESETTSNGNPSKKSDITVQKKRINEVTATHNCNMCNKSFSCRRLLDRHLKRHEKWEERKNLPKKPLNTDQRFQFKCDICGRRFNKPESLHKHKQRHIDHPEGEEKIYACDVCDKTYSSKRSLGYHKNRKHSEEPIAVPKRHLCKFCNKGFQFRANLDDHLRSHTGEKPFLCSLCGKSYISSSVLNQHLIRHSGIKEVECPDCPKKFACSSDLSKHRVTHRLVKPHNCDLCGASFAKSMQLKTHKMYHNGDKPYKCEYCDMRFVLMFAQRRHMRTHTGEKPYKCKYCERACAQSGDLVKHLRIHLGENVYKCELCPSAFRLATELRLHFASHRNDDEETRARNLLALKEEDASLRLNLNDNGCLSLTNG